MGNNKENVSKAGLLPPNSNKKNSKLQIKFDKKKEEWIYPSTEKVYQKAKSTTVGVSPYLKKIHLTACRNITNIQKSIKYREAHHKKNWTDDPKLEKMIIIAITFNEEN